MKKFISIILVFVCMLSITSCAEAPTIDSIEETAEPTIPAEVVEKNPLFLSVGPEITINGVTYSAAVLYEAYNGSVYTEKTGNFWVNRVNGKVFIKDSYSSTNRYSEMLVDTGLVYEGIVTIAGIDIQVPEIPTN